MIFIDVHGFGHVDPEVIRARKLPRRHAGLLTLSSPNQLCCCLERSERIAGRAMVGGGGYSASLGEEPAAMVD